MNSFIALLARFWNQILGKSNKILDKFENPEEQLRVFVDQMNKEIVKITQSTTKAIADEKKLKLSMENQLNQANDWEGKAMFALEQGKEDLAKEALIKKEECEQNAKNFKVEWQTQCNATATLKTNLKASKDKVEKAKREYNVLLARFQTAKTTQQINKTLNGQSTKSPTYLVENLQDKIHKIEAQTEAELEMLDNSSSTDLEAQFAELEMTKKGDDALLELKQKMKQIEQKPEHDDIDELKKKVS
ncbi:MAG: PspA/IM30 family protein [Halobacteriovoraceae bacterium]|jgi:phage shock protein A|nr:PspA/IM30 family protein [Halobacteriovoraceae bacterium]